MNLVIRKHTILEHKPPWPPPFAIIHPLIQYSANTIPYQVVDLDLPLIHRRHHLIMLTQIRILILIAAVFSHPEVLQRRVVVAVGVESTRRGGLRRLVRRRRHWGKGGGSAIGNWGNAAKRMHVK